MLVWLARASAFLGLLALAQAAVPQVAAERDAAVAEVLAFEKAIEEAVVRGDVAFVDRDAAVAEVLAFEKAIEEAVVRGDVAFVDRALAADFSFVHGDGWTHGAQPLAVDDKAAFLRRVANREYLVHDLDGVKTEMHGDVAITYGRYVSLFAPRSREAAEPARLSSIWFERVYARRNGQWQFLSHRTVHGPNVSPAGVDATAKPRN